MNKKLLYVLMFFLILVVLFWMMPDSKINTIGGFFEKISPISYALFGATGVNTIMTNYRK